MQIDVGRWQIQQGEPMEDRPSNASNIEEDEGIKQSVRKVGQCMGKGNEGMNL